MSATDESASVAAGRVVGESPLRIWALTSQERLRRQMHRAGAGAPAALALRTVLLRADWVYDDAIVRGLATAGSDVALMAPGGECIGANVPTERAEEVSASIAAGRMPGAVSPITAEKIADGYNDALRKRESPFLMPLTEEGLPAIEQRVFGGAYKGVTDLVTLYAWPAPARAATRWCADRGITPNQVTFASLLLVLAAMALFWHGHYVLGLLAAWPMTFLDTVDGKLARVTLTSTKFGNVFDHGIDLIHPPFWWWAWIVGLPAAGHPLDHGGWVLTVIVAGYILQRLEEGLFIAWFGMEIHVWTWFDSKFRLITARRNPNLLILTVFVLFGHPETGIVVVAWWVALCLVLHGVRIWQASQARREGPLRSWLQS